MKGISFDDRSITAADERTQENTPLIDSLEQPYRPIRTTGFIVLHILFTVDQQQESSSIDAFAFQVAFIAGIVLFPYQICPDHPRNSTEVSCNNHSGYNIALYIHAGAYVVNLAFDR